MPSRKSPLSLNKAWHMGENSHPYSGTTAYSTFFCEEYGTQKKQGIYNLKELQHDAHLGSNSLSGIKRGIRNTN